MAYTFISASYANKEHTAIVAMTKEAAAVVFSEVDTPDDWASLHDGKIDISPFVEPEIAKPSKEDLLMQLEAIKAQILSTE